jgi:hypothetical protein
MQDSHSRRAQIACHVVHCITPLTTSNSQVLQSFNISRSFLEKWSRLSREPLCVVLVDLVSQNGSTHNCIRQSGISQNAENNWRRVLEGVLEDSMDEGQSS